MCPRRPIISPTRACVYTAAVTAVISVWAADKKTIARSYDLGGGARAVNQIAYTKHLKNRTFIALFIIAATMKGERESV